MKLILLGPPGSGKGTVSERLTKDFKLTHISPGEMLREEVIKKTSLGEEIDQYISKGHLVPDHIVSDIVNLKIRNHPHFLLDGYPRNLEQARNLENFTKIDLIIYLGLSEEIAVERISGRLTCEKCEASYHIKYIPPKKPGLCDICGGKLIQRKDQKPAVVKERFKVYQEQSLPLLKHYQRKKLLKTVDASLSPKEVYQAVKQVVKKIL